MLVISGLIPFGSCQYLWRHVGHPRRNANVGGSDNMNLRRGVGGGGPSGCIARHPDVANRQEFITRDSHPTDLDPRHKLSAIARPCGCPATFVGDELACGTLSLWVLGKVDYVIAGLIWNRG